MKACAPYISKRKSSATQFPARPARSSTCKRRPSKIRELTQTLFLKISLLKCRQRTTLKYRRKQLSQRQHRGSLKRISPVPNQQIFLLRQQLLRRRKPRQKFPTSRS